MTPMQQQVLALVIRLNQDEFSGDFNPSEIMAFVQVESSFRPHAFRREPSGVSSYGLMQVLDVTARQFGVLNPADMWQPETSLRVGMKVANQYWDLLARHFGREPTYEEWSDSYNRGPGAVFRKVDGGNEPDDAYVSQWLHAQEFWAQQPHVDDAPA